MTTKNFIIPKICLPYLMNGEQGELTEQQLENNVFEVIPDTDIPHITQQNAVLGNGLDYFWVVECTCLTTN